MAQTTIKARQIDITAGGNVTEKVLNTQCKCKAYLNSAQNNLTDATNVKVLLDTEIYDIGADFDTANSRFTAPVSGYYLVSGAVGFSGVIADKTYQTLVYVNGIEVSYAMVHSSHTGSLRVQFSDIVYVSAGQYIELYARANAGASTVDLIAALASTYLNIHLLSV